MSFVHLEGRQELLDWTRTITIIGLYLVIF